MRIEDLVRKPMPEEYLPPQDALVPERWAVCRERIDLWLLLEWEPTAGLYVRRGEFPTGGVAHRVARLLNGEA